MDGAPRPRARVEVEGAGTGARRMKLVRDNLKVKLWRGDGAAHRPQLPKRKRSARGVFQAGDAFFERRMRGE